VTGQSALNTVAEFKPVQAEMSPLPKPVDHKAKTDERMKPLGAVLFRALSSSGDVGLSWVECLALTSDGDPMVGQVVTWMRSKGVSIEARYVAGETRFYLMPSDVGATTPE
jgi:hypothetical protein